MPAELRTLVELSRTLGEPSRDLVILAEGNTSIRTEQDRMLVKASGSQLGTAAGEDFVEVDTRTMLDLVNDEAADEGDVERVFGELGRGGKRPSVEAMLHPGASSSCRSTRRSDSRRSVPERQRSLAPALAPVPSGTVWDPPASTSPRASSPSLRSARTSASGRSVLSSSRMPRPR